MSNIKDIGDAAKSLAKNPIGIIALFIVLIYGIASLVVSFSGSLLPSDRTPIVWFLVTFPFVVLIVFAWLVSKHHTKLYAPSDFRHEENFLQRQRPELSQLDFAEPNPIKPNNTSSTPNIREDLLSSKGGSRVNIVDISTTESVDLSTPEGRKQERELLYAKHKGYFLVHVVEPSKEEGQLYDIFIYLIRHKSNDYSDVESAEFFFGSYWGNKIFHGSKMGKLIGVKTAAYGPFLCTCHVKFKNGEFASIYRYIDFEMGSLLKNAIKEVNNCNRTLEQC